MKNREKGFFDHLDDLTGLITRIGIVVVISSLIVYLFSPNILRLFHEHTLAELGIQLSTIRPAEILITKIKISLFGGLFLASPVAIPVIWSYIRPALKRNERRIITVSLIPALALFAAGFIFSYSVILPLAVRFLHNLAVNSNITPHWTVSSYVSLILSLGFAFGAAFELPIVIVVLSFFGITSADKLTKFRKYMIVSILIISAILTPPDFVSQILLALPLIILYEISIITVRVVTLSKKSKSC